MDVREQTWAPSEVTGVGLRYGRHGIGRGMKVGREQILGLLAAIAEHVEDPERHEPRYQAELSALELGLVRDRRLLLARTRNHHLAVPEVQIDVGATGHRADAVIRALDAGEPRIHVGEDQAWRDVLVVNPMGLHPGEGRVIAARLLAILESDPGTTSPAERAS
jgi:L-seryl-tRNA(Ser) seleniumtransferase